MMMADPPPIDVYAKLRAAKNQEESMIHGPGKSDPLWSFEIMNTQRKVNDLLGVVVTLMTLDYTRQAQPIAHEAARLALELELAIRERNRARPDDGSECCPS
jgi:hypothetical protein